MNATDEAEMNEFVKTLEPKLHQLMLGIVTPMQQKAQEPVAWIHFASAVRIASGPDIHVDFVAGQADKMLEEFRKRFAK